LVGVLAAVIFVAFGRGENRKKSNDLEESMAGRSKSDVEVRSPISTH
jgi:hypothetical protein